jgi:hypothetical protein
LRVVSNGVFSLAKKGVQQKRMGSLKLRLRWGVICVWKGQGCENVHGAYGYVVSNAVTKLAVRSEYNAGVRISFDFAEK